MNYILITGGAGFIGSSLADKFIREGNNYVIIVDDLSTGDKSKLPETPQTNWKFIKCDVNNYRDIAEIMHSYSFDYVFHYAALVGVQRTQDNPVSVLADLHGIENILNLSKNSGVRRVFFSSSSEVYGEPINIPQNEYTTPLNSRLPYAVVKNVGEAYCRSYKNEYDLDYTIFRFFNTYGPKQSRDFVMSRFISMALKNEPITIYGDGSQTRTFCYINDNIEATYTATVQDILINDVANIGGDVEVSMLELAETVIKLTHSKSEIVFLPPLEEGDMKRRFPDITKMKDILKRDLIPIEEGIKKILENPQFILESPSY